MPPIRYGLNVTVGIEIADDVETDIQELLALADLHLTVGQVPLRPAVVARDSRNGPPGIAAC